MVGRLGQGKRRWGTNLIGLATSTLTGKTTRCTRRSPPPACDHRPGSTTCLGPSSTTRPRRPARPSALLRSDRLVRRHPRRAGPVDALRQRRDVRLHRWAHPGRHQGAVLVADLGPLPPVGRIPPATLTRRQVRYPDTRIAKHRAPAPWALTVRVRARDWLGADGRIVACSGGVPARLDVCPSRLVVW